MKSAKPEYELIAAVDLGSNSFRLQVGRVVEGQVYPLDGLKEAVRLAAGLTPQKYLDEPAQVRALEALRRFGERLRGFQPGAVRAVGTNALRVAKNGAEFLEQAQVALGFPIEIIAGREEARLIYVGVAHTLPNPATQQLVVDIGGGSTEFIIGRNFKPLALESLYMGCVSYSLQYFPGGKVDKHGMREAEVAARRELQAISRRYKELNWAEAVGSSGSAKAMLDILEQNGWSSGGITRDGLEQLRALLLRAGDMNQVQAPGVRPDRIPVLPGGLSIMLAVFKEFGLERMTFSEGALRLGVLYDLVGRYHHQDLRDATVRQFTRRYHVEAGQARRVADTAATLLGQLLPSSLDENDNDGRFLRWAARLHEIGVSVAHSGYHKHSAYILANADMPGFSRMDQSRLSRIVLAHRGKLERVQAMDPDSKDWLLILALRLAVLMNRSRDGSKLPPVSLSGSARSFVLTAAADWLDYSPLTASALEEETRQWRSLGIELRIKRKPVELGGI